MKQTLTSTLLVLAIGSLALAQTNAVNRGIATAPASRPSVALEQYYRGLKFQKAGHIKEAVEQYELATAPDAECTPALNHFSWFLAAYPDAAWRNGKRSVEYGLRACAAAKADNNQHLLADCLDTLSVAYAESGDFANAIVSAQKALDMAKEAKWSSRSQLFAERLQLFQAHQAYHDVPPATQP